MSRMRKRWTLLAAAVLAISTPVEADSFFNVTATGSGGGSVVVGGGNIINLADNVIHEENAFAGLAGQNVTANFTYGGVPNALIFTENAAQTSATLTIPSTGFTKTFSGTDSTDLKNQIQNFIKGDAQSAYAQFLQAMDQTSPDATLDGNPEASTALIANGAFQWFGIHNQQSTELKDAGSTFYVGPSVEGSASRSGGVDGTAADVLLATGWRITDNVGFTTGTVFNFRDIGGSDVYTVAEVVGLPITFINNKGNGISLQVTPWAFGGLSASYNQAAGSVLVGGGGTSSLAMHMGALTITLGDQLSYAGDAPVNVDGYGFDTVVNQWIFKNGVDANYRFAGPFFVDGSLSYSNFLRKAAIPDYWSPSVGVGIDFDRHSSLRFSYEGDFAKRYNSSGADVMLIFAY